MTQKNRYYSRSKISEAKFRQLIRYFAMDLTATDRWRGYDGLVDVGFDKHFRVNHGQNEFARGNAHVNGIESFWSYAKRRLIQFNSVPMHTFYLHMKETEFRFNHRNSDLYKALLSLLNKHPL